MLQVTELGHTYSGDNFTNFSHSFIVVFRKNLDEKPPEEFFHIFAALQAYVRKITV